MQLCKKMLSILLTVMLLLTGIPFAGLFSAQAAEVLDSGPCGDNVNWTMDSNGTLTISGEGDMYNSTEFDYLAWYDYIEDITSIVIADGVISIGERIFASCTALENVTIADSVTSIGLFAFGGCTSLENVHIPDSVTNIELGAFVQCTSLESITVDTQNAYYTSVDGVLYAKDHSRIVCYPAAKQGTTFTVPDTVVGIDDYAFAYNTALTNVIMADSVNYIGMGAFGFCTALDNISFSDNSQLSIIGDEAFCNCAGLSNIVIPDCVTRIGNSAFAACVSLVDVEFPDTVTESVYGFSMDIGESAFSYCGALENINIPDSVTSIVYGMFAGCVSLDTMTFPSSLVSIEPQAFRWCSSLETINIPVGVTTIGESAFDMCDELSTVNYSGSEEAWNAIEIGEFNDALRNANIIYLHQPDTDSVFITADGDVAGLAGTTVCALLGIVGAGASVVDKNGKALTGNDKIGTGSVVTLADAMEYVIVVPGDIDGDGEILSNDARSLLRNSVGLDPMNETQLKAGDVNGDGEITSSDARSALRASVALDNPGDWLVYF